MNTVTAPISARPETSHGRRKLSIVVTNPPQASRISAAVQRHLPPD